MRKRKTKSLWRVRYREPNGLYQSRWYISERGAIAFAKAMQYHGATAITITEAKDKPQPNGGESHVETQAEK